MTRTGTSSDDPLQIGWQKRGLIVETKLAPRTTPYRHTPEVCRIRSSSLLDGADNNVWTGVTTRP